MDNPADQTKNPASLFKKNNYTGKLILLLIILLVLGAAFAYHQKLLPSKTPKQLSSDTLMMVGNEKIYPQDIEQEKSYYPQLATDSANINNKLILNQLVEDSLVLQEANAQNIATLSAQIFNSPNKIFPARITAVIKAKQAFLKQKLSPFVSGAFVSIFFNNQPNNKSDTQLQKDKQIAFDKITNLYNQVKNKQLTINQAGEAIKNDSSLKAVDPRYQQNAYATFNVSPNKPDITFVTDFNNILVKLKPGELSPVFLGKDKDLKTGASYDAIYLFGEVDKRQDQSTSWTDFINELKRKYHVTY